MIRQFSQNRSTSINRDAIVKAVKDANPEYDQKQIAKKVKQLEEEVLERIRGDSSVKTATQTMESLLQEMETLVKVRRENTVAKLANPEEIGDIFCPQEQGRKRRTVGDRSFTDLDNSLQGKQYNF